MKTSFKSKDVISSTRPLQLLHMDLFGPTRMLSLGGKKYGSITGKKYGFTSMHINMSSSRSLRYFIREFKMKEFFVFLLLEAIMELSLRILSLNHYVKRMTFSTTFLHREHFNKMGWLKGIIELCKKWQGLYFVKTHFLNTFG